MSFKLLSYLCVFRKVFTVAVSHIAFQEVCIVTRHISSVLCPFQFSPFILVPLYHFKAQFSISPPLEDPLLPTTTLATTQTLWLSELKQT